VIADDVLDDLFLSGDMRLAALVTDEGQAHLLKVPATPFQDLHQALADQRRDGYATGLLPGGKRERCLPWVRTRVIDGCASLVEISCMAASPASHDGNR
jgi:hypothetical protein